MAVLVIAKKLRWGSIPKYGSRANTMVVSAHLPSTSLPSTSTKEGLLNGRLDALRSGKKMAAMPVVVCWNALARIIVDYKMERYFSLTPNQPAVNNPR